MKRARFVAVGDVGTDRDDPHTSFDGVRELLTSADLGFCQLEMNLTARGERMPQARHTVRGIPEMADAIVKAGLEVVSFAGNHCMDWGIDGLKDTHAALAAAGALQVGTGLNIHEARKPVIVERNGLKIGVLSVNSILPMAYWADERRAGCAPLRGHTYYEQIEPDQPGTPARIHSFAHAQDLEELLQSIRDLRPQVDVVILSHHAGIHFTPAIIPDYQREVAYKAIDAGADLILGSHAHILKGVEYYKGKAIIYSLANFAIDLRMDKAHAESKSFKEIQKLNPDWIPDFDSLYNFPPDSAMSIILDAELSENHAEVTLRPVWIGRDANPELLSPDDPRFAKVHDYLQNITDSEELGTSFIRDGAVLRMRPKA